MPLHIELCATYQCNYDCPWCNCRLSRLKMQKEQYSLTFSELVRIIDECHKHQVGIQWTGGEPLTNSALPKAIAYASSLSVKQCLFTNGSLLSQSIAEVLLKSNLSFIRISLNCVTPSIHSKFHGGIPLYVSERVLENFKTLCMLKSSSASSVQM